MGAVILVINLLGSPPTVDFTAHQFRSTGEPQRCRRSGRYGSGTHPTWVSYLVQSPAGYSGSTRRSSRCPHHTRINVTIDQYDSGSPLRNQQLGQVTGTNGNVATLNGKAVPACINSNAGNGVAHTFSIPTLGINVPLVRRPTATPTSAARPRARPSSPHNIIKFSFTSPGPGQTIPGSASCRAGCGWLYGNGGPMRTVGYMGGFLEVVA